MPKISVIMPVYNAIKYVETAINSILNQSFNDFELILIDDGATDGSSVVCQAAALQNSNVIYLQQENKGICAARNKGLEIARGDYIAFADHDDEYDPDYMRFLYTIALNMDADIVKCGVIIENVHLNGAKYRYVESFSDRLFDKDNIKKEYFDLPICFWCVWNGLYKRNLIYSSGVIFDETMKYGQEDLMFNLLLLPYINKVFTSKENLYFHFKRFGQSTSAKFNMGRLESMLKFYYEEKRQLCDLKGFEIALKAKTLASIATYIKENGINESREKLIEIYSGVCKEMYLDEIKTLDIFLNNKLPTKRKLVLTLAKNGRYNDILHLYQIKQQKSRLLLLFQKIINN